MLAVTLELFLLLFSPSYSVYRRQLNINIGAKVIKTEQKAACTKYFVNSDLVNRVAVREIDTQKIDKPCLTFMPVQLQLPESSMPLLTCQPTDEAVLGAVFPDQQHEIKNSSAANVYEGKVIAALPVKREMELKFAPVGYNIETVYTNELEDGKKVVEQKGQNGTQAQVIKKTEYPDKTEKETLVSSWVEKEPVTEKVKIGTKRVMKTTTIDGVTFQYWKTLTVVATSYDHNCKGCNEWTATGAYLTKGIVAVDPKVIKMHTKMYIPGYGFGKAEDTGGKIKGNRIDLGFDDVRYGNWSKRSVTIYLID